MVSKQEKTVYGSVVLDQARDCNDADAAALMVPITVNGVQHKARYWVCLPAAVQASSEVFFPLALLTAMFVGVDLHCEEPISARLLANVGAIEDIWGAWSERSRIAVFAQPRSARPPPSRGVASFFSGGIDSFYTVLTHLDEISHLIAVGGFDVPFGNGALWEKIIGPLRQAAAQLGKPLIEVRTDLRSFTDKYLSWEDAHGAAMASIALLLSPMFSRVLVPGSGTYATLLPWGTHPLLDPLWSTDETQLVPDGYQSTRFQKLSFISENPIVLETLRVCWHNTGNTYNCGNCGKCLQAMAMLRAIGRLQNARTFPHTFNLRQMSRRCGFGELDVPVGYLFQRSLRMALEHVKSTGTDPALAQALQDCVAGKYHAGFWRIWYRFADRFQAAWRRFSKRTMT